LKRRESKTLLDESAFEALLAHLDKDRNAAGEKYVVLRRRLVQVLAWRGSHKPEELADETLSRAGKALLRPPAILNLESFCVGIARLVALEDARRQRETSLDETHGQTSAVTEPVENDARSVAFDECLSAMTETSRNLILGYYGSDGQEKIQNRRKLAAELGIPLNALRIRACRIRGALERCIEGKMEREGGNT